MWQNQFLKIKINFLKSTETSKSAIFTERNKTRRDFLKARFPANSETVDIFQAKICHDLKCSTQNLSRCKILHLISDTLFRLTFKILIFEAERKLKNLSFLRSKSSLEVTYWMQSFVPNFTRCKNSQSKSDVL